MRLLEFLETIRENDSSGPGKFVGARLTRDSERAIMRWMRDNGLRKKEPRARLHITVVGDQTQDFDWTPATFDPPLEIDPNSYKLEKFGDKAIVLSFSVPELEKRHEQAIKKHGIKWQHPTYQPHITLSFDPTGLNDMERLLKPTFPMYVSNEYAQPWEFNEEDSRTERRRKARMDEAFLAERNLMNAPEAKEWATHSANRMFGTERGAAHLGHAGTNYNEVALTWAQRALAKYLVNEIPATQILSFEPDPGAVVGPTAPQGREITGRGKIATPMAPGYGILQGHKSDKAFSVSPWVPEALARGDEVFWLDKRGLSGIDSDLASVRDWFRNLSNNNPERLNAGRLSRMSWAQAVEAAYEWHDSMKASVDDHGEQEDHREIYLDMGDGFAWWKLTGETCLDREGELMGHCVADYLHEVENNEVTILSLRDKKNQPHVTVELREGNELEIAQVKGKENEPPVKKYWPYVDALLKKLDSEGKYLVVGDGEEGYHDLEGCGILALNNVFVRTNKDLNNAAAWLRATYYPEYTKAGEGMEEKEIAMNDSLDNIIHGLQQGDFFVLPEDEGYEQIFKWHLIRHGSWETETEGTMENPNFDGEKHDNLDPNDPEPWIEGVPISIMVGLPGIEHEIIAGDPEKLERTFMR